MNAVVRIPITFPSEYDDITPLGGNLGQGILPDRIARVAPGLLHLWQNFYGACYGVKELVCDRVKQPSDAGMWNEPLLTRIGMWCRKFFHELKEDIVNLRYQAIHGLLLIGSGTCGTVGSLHEIGVINLGNGYPVCNAIETGFSFASCLMGMHYYVKLYWEAGDLPQNPTDEQIAISQRRKTSAIMGLLSCISYLISTVISVLTGAALMAFILNCLGSLTSSLKTLYDFFYSV